MGVAEKIRELDIGLALDRDVRVIEQRIYSSIPEMFRIWDRWGIDKIYYLIVT